MLSGQKQKIITNPNLQYFREAYKEHPPWEIGRPQEIFIKLAETGRIKGSVLDIGCGTGENAIFLAKYGLLVWGVDFVPEALEHARAHARQLGVHVTFLELDALHLEQLKRKFDVVIDSGFFHTLSDADRPRLLESLKHVLIPGGRYFMLVFSDTELGTRGPRRITQKEIWDTFKDGWQIEVISPQRFETTWSATGAKAWLAIMTRIA